jgi:glycosyltransferase involved in cell wall biosynthesis
MRVILAADFPVQILPGFNGGPAGHHATWLTPLAQELSTAPGFDFHWITCTKLVSKPREIRHLNQTFHLLPRGKLSLEMLTRFRRERRLIAALVGKLQPDLLHGWGTEQGYALAANDFPGRSLISLQGILTAYCAASPMPLLTRIQAASERSALAKAKQLTAESPWGADQLRKLAPSATIDLLEYGADPACFKIQRILPPSHEATPFTRESRGATPFTRPAAVFLGSLTHLKGVDTLLAAFSDPLLSGIDLHIYGAGEKRFAEGNHPPNIHFHGHRPRAEVLQALSQAWCLVHPTRADTSPNAVKEARVIGLPVVTTPEGGQTQYVTHNKSGFIHPPGDREGLIQGVLAATADCETSLRIGATDQENCRQLLHPSRTAELLLQIYKR